MPGRIQLGLAVGELDAMEQRRLDLLVRIRRRRDQRFLSRALRSDHHMPRGNPVGKTSRMATIILKLETKTAPTTYTYNKETVFVDSQGKIVTYETVKDSPVTISYVQDGDYMIVIKVTATGPQVRKETTTTTTTETR
jgi:hypothetical protein